MSQKIYSNLDIKGNTTIGDIANATSDTDKFLVSDAGVVKYRTGSEMLSDLGVAPGVASNIQHQVKAGVAINKGQAVYVTGADGTNMIVGLASNAAEVSSSKTMGLMSSTVAINGFGNVIAEGLLAGLNTSTANAGDPVWLGTGGNLIYGTVNKPYAPSHLVFIGIVTRSNTNNGEIFVKVQNGFELDELHDADLKTTTPINGHILGYNGTLWVNKTIAAWLGYTPVSQARTLTINGTSYDLSADRSWSIAAGVTSFNTRTGAITLTSGDVTGALGYTPYNATNPNGYISSYTETDTLASVTSRGASTSSNVTLSGITRLGGSGYKTYIEGGLMFRDYGNNSLTNGRFYYQDDAWHFRGGGEGEADVTSDTAMYIRSGNIERLVLHDGNISSYAVPSSRTITINGTSYDLSANRSWTVTASETDTLATVVARGDITNGGRPIRLDTSGGGVSIRGSAGGWATGYYFMGGTSNTYRGGFGALGDNDNLTNYWIGPAYNAYYTYIDSSQMSHSSSMRAPIFYDSNDTSYYIDPNSDSRLWRGRFGDSSRNMMLGNWDGSNARIEAVGGPLFLTSYGGSIKFGYSGSSQMELTTSGNLSVPAQVIASSFADYDDTGYYANFASTSDLAVRQRGGTLHGPNPTWGAYLLVGGDGRQNYTDSTTVASVCATNGNLHLDSASGYSTHINFYDGNDIILGGGANNEIGRVYNSGYLQMNGSLRSPIFYDSNNTGYYVDPASTTNLYGLQITGASNKYLYINPGNGYEAMVRYNGGSGNTWYAGKRTTSTTQAGTEGFHFYSDAAGDTVFGIGTDGTTKAKGDVVAYSSSDRQLKDNILPIENALEKVNKIGGYTFDWNDKQTVYEGHDVGVIAQEIETVLPEVVTTRDTGFKAVKYEKIVPLLIEAIKEQQIQIEELKKLVNQLTNK